MALRNLAQESGLDASRRRLAVRSVIGDLVRSIRPHGYFVDRVSATGNTSRRTRVLTSPWALALEEDFGGERWSTALVDLKQVGPGKSMMRSIHGISPSSQTVPIIAHTFGRCGRTSEPDLPGSTRPHQRSTLLASKVTVTQDAHQDHYGDVFVDTDQAHGVTSAG